MMDPLFQRIFPEVRIDPNKRSLERWGTTKAGVMHAVPTGGKLTGKGAGLLVAKYSGCFVVDDVSNRKMPTLTQFEQKSTTDLITPLCHVLPTMVA